MEALLLVVKSLDPAGFIAVLARVGGVVTFFPLLGAELIPARFRLFLAVALAWLMRPFLPPAAFSLDDGMIAYAGRIGAELLVGFAMGFSAQIVMGAFEMAGQFVGLQMGLTLSGVIDPFNGEQVGPFSVLYRMVALLV